MLQTTLIQLDNYGPWTVTPEPRPEMTLQALQSRLYADLAERIGRDGGYVFYVRGDNMIAVTNGLDRDDHVAIQGGLADRYPVTVSMAIGVASTPAASLADASARLQAAGSAQDTDRAAVLLGDPASESAEALVHVAHFDVNDVTERYTDRLGAFETYLAIERGAAALMRYMYRVHEALTFFVGGDNVIAVCPPLSSADYQQAIRHVREETGVDLKVGVGSGGTARSAGMRAKHALEACREHGRPIVRSAQDDACAASAD